MNAIQSAIESPRFNRILFWIGAAVLAAGVVVLIVKFAGGSDSTSVNPQRGFKPTLPGKAQPLYNAHGVKVTTYRQLDPDVKVAIRRFILGAVAGKNYADSWKYTTPNLRQGYTYRQWVHSSSRPFVPFPVYKLAQSHRRLVYAHKQEILVEIALSAKPKLGLRPTTFWISLVPAKGSKRWLVNYWAPRWTPPIKIN